MIKKYIDFTDGIEIWVSREKNADIYVVSYDEPTIEDYLITVPIGSTQIRYSSDIWKENIRLNAGEKIKVKASEHPGLLVALENHKKADRILKKVGECLKELHSIEEFCEVNITYDNQNDISSSITWSDERNDMFL